MLPSQNKGLIMKNIISSIIPQIKYKQNVTWTASTAISSSDCGQSTWDRNSN